MNRLQVWCRQLQHPLVAGSWCGPGRQSGSGARLGVSSLLPELGPGAAGRSLWHHWHRCTLLLTISGEGTYSMMNAASRSSFLLLKAPTSTFTIEESFKKELLQTGVTHGLSTWNSDACPQRSSLTCIKDLNKASRPWVQFCIQPFQFQAISK